MGIRRTIKFDLQPRKGKDGNLLTENRPIRMRLSFAGERIDICIGQTIDSVFWDSEAGLVIPKAKSKFGILASEINQAIETYTALTEQIFSKYEYVDKVVPTAEQIKRELNDLLELKAKKKKFRSKKDRYSVFDAMDEFTSSMGMKNNWTLATYSKFKTLKKHMMDYSPSWKFSEITDEKMNGYMLHLQRSGLRNTTIAKNIGFFRWFLHWCVNNDRYSGHVHDSFRPKLKGLKNSSKTIIYLTWDELITLYDYRFTSLKHDTVRDVFCFCCFTGLRFSDVKKLKRDDVKEKWFHVVTQKTNDVLKIELNKFAHAILFKYRDYPSKNNLALPVISNVKMNVYIKEAAKIAGINEPVRLVYFKGNQRYEAVFPKYSIITTHVGRKSFIVNSLYLGIPIEVVMKWTGHSDYNAMKPYLEIVDKLKAKEMTKFDDAFDSPKIAPIIFGNN